MIELDIWRAANLMIERYGDRAELEAAERATELRADDAFTAAEAWDRIIAVMVVLRAAGPTRDAPMIEHRAYDLLLTPGWQTSGRPPAPAQVGLCQKHLVRAHVTG